jgi:hypothetical protein
MMKNQHGKRRPEGGKKEDEEADDLLYPLRLVFFGGINDYDMPRSGYELHGPFDRPGQLWAYANEKCYLNVHAAWREDASEYLRKKATAGWREIKMALDRLAIEDLEEYDVPGQDRVRVLRGEEAWQSWLALEEEEGPLIPPPENWHVAGPVCSCGCEDWPCCVHADDYVLVP